MACFLLHAGEPGVRDLLHFLDVEHGRELPAGRSYDAVIRYGALCSEPEEGLVLNRVKPVLRALNLKSVQELLRLNGMKVGDPVAGKNRRDLQTADWICEYRIPVFNLEALTVFEKKTAGPVTASFLAGRRPRFREIPMEERTFHVRRAIREAVKAVYALGLDYGMVRVAVLPEGDTQILDVDPVPSLEGRLAERFAVAINRLESELAKDSVRRLPPMLGCDPEFVLQRPDGKAVSASRYLERDGTAGCDSIVWGGPKPLLPLAELRPAPSRQPKKLVARLQTAMRQAEMQIADPDLAWRAGGMPVNGLPLGGHIHFSGISLNGDLLRALDNYLALPLVLLEGEQSRKRRPKYGRPGDFRRKNHGGFEYRPLPSWLATPDLAECVLTLAGFIAENYRELPGRLLDHREMRRLFYYGDSHSIRPAATALWNDLEKLPGYKIVQEPLDRMKEMLFGEKKLDLSADFRSAWNIGFFTKSSEKAVGDHSMQYPDMSPMESVDTRPMTRSSQNLSEDRPGRKLGNQPSTAYLAYPLGVR